MNCPHWSFYLWEIKEHQHKCWLQWLMELIRYTNVFRIYFLLLFLRNELKEASFGMWMFVNWTCFCCTPCFCCTVQLNACFCRQQCRTCRKEWRSLCALGHAAVFPLLQTQLSPTTSTPSPRLAAVPPTCPRLDRWSLFLSLVVSFS